MFKQQIRTWVRLVAVLSVLALAQVAPAAPALVALPEASPTQSAPQSPPPGAAIASQRRAGEDAQIAARIEGIFSELPTLRGVDVSSREGVVTLAGSVANAEDKARAEAIAARVAGVVTVENGIRRDTSLDSATAGVGQLTDKLARIPALLPLLGAALLVWFAVAGTGYLIAGLGGLWRRLTPNAFLAELIASAIRFVFVVGGLVVALDMLGAGALMGAVLGGAGVVGIALGFAMRDTIENYVASLMLSLRQPFRANDHVVIEGSEGRVIRLTSRATVLMTLDGNHLRIPNSAVFKAVILNYTRNPQRRFEFEVGVDADDDPTAARRLGRDTLAGLPFVLDDPPPEGRIVEVGDSNIVLGFLGWIDQRETDWYKARSNAIAAVKQALEGGGFALPEPIYRLRFDPRTTPVPFEDIAGKPKDAAKPPPKPREPPEQADVAPQNEVADMVDKERSAGGSEQGEKDLLDPRRPVE